MELDHILLAASDLEADARRFADQYGLEAYAGGRHPSWGTSNWIVPLGGTYLELIAVVDERAATQSGVGRWVAEARPGSPLAWAVRPDDLDATASRLRLDTSEGSRTRPSGEVVTWRTAGLAT